MKHYDRQDQRALAIWAVECAERVLPLFEKRHPDDNRPRAALDAGRAWIDTGEFHMPIIRGASLGAHTAARTADPNSAAFYAARAAGQAVATAHVPQHAFGGAYYALKAIAADNPAQAEQAVAAEWQWQSTRLPDHLRDALMRRIVVASTRRGLTISIDKSGDF